MDIAELQKIADLANQELQKEIASKQTNTALAYCAGFFDAEGCVNICSRKESNCYSLRIFFTNTNINSLNFVSSILGGKIYSRNGWESGWKISHQLQFCSTNASNALSLISPFLISKKRRTELAIKFQELYSRKELSVEDCKYFKEKINSENSRKGKNANQENVMLNIQKLKNEKIQKIIESINTKHYSWNNNETIAYLSGFFDGEGYIVISKSRKKYFILRIGLSNSNIEPLQLASLLFGGYIYTSKSYNQNILYHFSLNSKGAANALDSMLQYLIIKKSQAEIAIEFQQKHITKNLSVENCEKYFALISSLKHRVVSVLTEEERNEKTTWKIEEPTKLSSILI